MEAFVLALNELNYKRHIDTCYKFYSLLIILISSQAHRGSASFHGSNSLWHMLRQTGGTCTCWNELFNELSIIFPAHPSAAARQKADWEWEQERESQAEHHHWGGGGRLQQRDHPPVPRHPGHEAPPGVIRRHQPGPVSTQGVTWSCRLVDTTNYKLLLQRCLPAQSGQTTCWRRLSLTSSTISSWPLSRRWGQRGMVITWAWQPGSGKFRSPGETKLCRA